MNNIEFAIEMQGDPTYLVVENDKTLATYASMQCAHIWVAWCCEMLLKTSSSVNAMVLNTTTKAGLSEALLLCRWR
ncbi:hypothetical protein L6164_008623 [Bauhinia variegata]|uniref:Uncharacterized protein n=1 Tax=Bauhinia variegata TaxID=167791 RepID=A0ACB9PHC0_BAUVA|nr:hypothetical protein L6164_008623 [Bauhinia variegata]